MKRVGYLFEKIHDWDNLLKAYQRARKGKHGGAVDEFGYDWEMSLYRIQQELIQGTFSFGAYHSFMIHEPKERLITAAPFSDRVVHHAICNVIGPIIDKPLIVDSYACRKGKGLHRAVKKAFYLYRHSRYHYRLDISKFYYSIDQAILMDMLKKKLKDARVLNLISRLLETHESGREYYHPFIDDDLFDLIRPRGLPIGNLSSQLFANYYLCGIDHFVREQLRHTKYIRYMDDILIFSNDKDDLHQARAQIKARLASIRLTVNPKKDIIQSNVHGVDWLGFRIIGNTIRIRSQNLARFRKKIRLKSRLSVVDLKSVLRSFNGHLGYLLGGHTKRICNVVLNDIEFHGNHQKWKLVV